MTHLIFLNIEEKKMNHKHFQCYEYKHMNINMEKADLGNTVCSSISRVFPDEITYTLFR